MPGSTSKIYVNFTIDEKIDYYEKIALEPKTPERKRSHAIKRRLELIQQRNFEGMTKSEKRKVRDIQKNNSEMDHVIAVSKAQWLED